MLHYNAHSQSLRAVSTLDGARDRQGREAQCQQSSSPSHSNRMRLLLSPVLLLVSARLATSLALTTRSVEARALCEWLQMNNRLSSGSLTLAPENNGLDQCAATTTRPVARGEVLFRLSNNAIWSASSAYEDRDLGPKLKDFARKAGPGFGVVALAGVVSCEKVRRYRSREGLGAAPESTGFIVPSRWGAFARGLWSMRAKRTFDANDEPSADEVRTAVLQGVNLLVPLLDMAARRAWTASAADDSEPPASFLAEEWAREAMLNDGAAVSWSKGDLEQLAAEAFELVMEWQRPPPQFLRTGVGSLVPDPFLDEDAPETWPGGEPLALVPMVDDLFVKDESHPTNVVLGSPPRGLVPDGGDSLWCVATRRLETGERIVASNPWES